MEVLWTMTEQTTSVSERGRYGDLQILTGELTESYQPVDEDGNVKAKVWGGDDGARRLYLRVRDHDDGRRFNEFSVDLNKPEGEVWCGKCGGRTVDPSCCDLSPEVCESCRRELGGQPAHTGGGRDGE